MSDLSIMGPPDEDPRRPHSGRGRRRRRRPLARVVALAAVICFVIAGYLGFVRLKDHFAPPADYTGAGTGRVLYEVKAGETVTDMGRDLEKLGVVESVGAFIDAGRANPKSNSIQPGFYQLRHRMKATDALAVLVDPKKQIRTMVTIPEGFTVDQVVARLAAKTRFSAAAYRKVLASPSSIGVPSYAGDSAEGYLYPATYPVLPNSTPASILKGMVSEWRTETGDLNLAASAKKLGYTAQQVLTVASILELEVSRPEDRYKVARVIYNRLEGNETGGYLQLDTTVDYGARKPLVAHPSSAEVNAKTGPYATRYNTYIHKGLPPGPIDNPSKESIEAALHPAKGPWNYYVTVNLSTGETKFAATYKEFLAAKQEFLAYCNTHQKVCSG